jgi:TP901 family phage tail tape measure protein
MTDGYGTRWKRRENGVAGSKNEAKIQFTAETSDFTAAIKDANSEMSSLRAEMKLNEAQFQNTGDSTEYLQTKSELLQQQLEANRDKQEALTEKLEVARDIYGDDSAEVQKLENQLTYAQVEEQNLMHQVSDTNDAMNDQGDAADTAGEKVDSMAEILVNAGIASAISDIAQSALDMAQSFDEAEAAIVEGTGASGDALEELGDAAKKAYSNIADKDSSLTDVSNILAELNTRFGITGDQAAGVTEKIANFAKHTGTDGTKAVDSIANVTKRWGLGIDDVDGLLDDLTTANQSCQMSVDELTGYLTNNSTAFQELGYDTTDALALLISLSDSGANVGSVMGGMTKAVTNLSSVTKDVPGTFQEAIKAIGECDTVSEALQAQVGDTGKTVEDIFGKKAAQELAVNIQNGNFQIDKWTEALQNNEGALEGTTEGATTMQDSWSQAANNVSLALSQTFVPVISDVVKQVAEVVTKIAQVVQSSPELQAVIVGVAAGLGILATALAISSVISVVQKAFALLNTTMLANPIFLVVTALAALTAGLVYAYNNSETFRNVVNQAFEVMKSVVITVVTTVRDTVVTVFEAIKSAISTAVSTASTVVSNVFNTMKSTVTTIVNAISTAASTAFNVMKTAVTTAVNATKTAVTTVWNGIKSTVSTVVNAVRTTVTTVWNGIRSVTSSVWNGIKTAVTTPINAAKSAVSTTVNGIRSTMTSVFGGIRSTVSSIFSGIQSAITSPIQTAKNTLANLVSGIRGLFSGLHISLPHINLPHFRISGGTPPYGIAGKGTAPSIGIDWYAQGAVLKKATSFGINTVTGNRMVGGEAGYEAVAPIDVLQGYVQAAVESVVGNSALDYDLLADKIANACARTNTTLELDGRQLGRVVRGYV